MSQSRKTKVLVFPIPNALQLPSFMETTPEKSSGSEETTESAPEIPVDKTAKPIIGLRLELRGEGSYYKGILHIGSTLIPISDDILEELRGKTSLSSDEFFCFFVEKVGYSSYLQEQIHQEVKNVGDLHSQMSVIQQLLRME